MSFAPRLMTVEEFLALPDDGTDRELIRGVVRVRGQHRTRVRDRFHARTEARIARALLRWRDAQPEPRGEVVSGGCGFRLMNAPESLVGIDVAYVSPKMEAAADDTVYAGPPVLAVEIGALTDTYGEIWDRVELHLEAGAVVWDVHPNLRTVTVIRPGHHPKAFSASMELSADPYLPGFRVRVAEFFE